MLVHSVFFWLNPNLSETDRAAFVAGVESLRTVPSVSSVFIGRPACMPPRPVVDQSYSYALTVLFADIAAHDAYQIDPIHKAFVEANKSKWVRVQIYDAL